MQLYYFCQGGALPNVEVITFHTQSGPRYGPKNNFIDKCYSLICKSTDDARVHGEAYMLWENQKQKSGWGIWCASAHTSIHAYKLKSLCRSEKLKRKCKRSALSKCFQFSRRLQRRQTPKNREERIPENWSQCKILFRIKKYTGRLSSMTGDILVRSPRCWGNMVSLLLSPSILSLSVPLCLVEPTTKG